MAEPEFGGFDFQGDSAARERFRGCVRLRGIKESDGFTSVDNGSIENMSHCIAFGDDFDGVPPIAFVFAAEMFLIGDPFAAEHARHAAEGRGEERRHGLFLGFWVDRGVEPHAVQRDEVADVGLLDLELKRGARRRRGR